MTVCPVNLAPSRVLRRTFSAAETLAHQLGAEPPAGLTLSEADTQRLADLIRAARRAQGEELQASLEKALEIVPRPLRGTVRKVVGL